MSSCLSQGFALELISTMYIPDIFEGLLVISIWMMMIICNKFRSRGNSHHDVSDIIFNIFFTFLRTYTRHSY